MLSRTLGVDGGPVHLADFGGTGPTMILVHGLGGSHANWLAVGPGLAAHARVLAPGLPGFGRTPLAGRPARARANVEPPDRRADPASVPPDVVAAHVALARERQRMPWAQPAFLEAARSILAVLARRREVQAMVRRITAPTLLVQGTEDRLVPLAASRALATLQPDWRLAVFERVGHVPQLEAPERFVATVAGWLDDAGRSTG